MSCIIQLTYCQNENAISVLCAADDGCFLGINPNFQIFIKGLTTQNRTEIEVGAEDDVDLARKLFLAIFKRELSEEPNNVYCTKVDGKKILNPTFLTAIRCKSQS